MARSPLICLFIALMGAFFAAPASGYARIVSLYPGHTDNIVALGAGASLVAVSKNESPYINERFKSLPKLPINVGTERVMSLKPDMVIARSLTERANGALFAGLRAAGIGVLILDPPRWNDFPEYLKTLASAVDKNPDEAVQKLESLKRGLARQVPTSGAKPRVFVEATAKELHTCAPDSWAASLIELCGGVNAASSAKPLREGSALAPWGTERAVKTARNLDVYIVQNGVMNASRASDVLARPWAGALKGVRVREMQEAHLSRPSLLGLEQGGRELIKILHGK